MLINLIAIPTTRGTTGNEEEDGAWATPDAVEITFFFKYLTFPL